MQSYQIAPISFHTLSFDSAKSFTLDSALNTLDYCQNYEDLEQLLHLLHCFHKLPRDFPTETRIPKEFIMWIDLPKDVAGLALCRLVYVLTCSWKETLAGVEGKEYSEKVMRIEILEEDIDLFSALNRNMKLGLNVALSLLFILNITECRETVKSNTESLREFWTLLEGLDESTCNAEIRMLKNAVLVFLSAHITCGTVSPLTEAKVMECWKNLSPVVKTYWLDAMIRSDMDAKYKTLAKEFEAVKLGVRNIEESIRASFLNYSGTRTLNIATKEMMDYRRSLQRSYVQNSRRNSERAVCSSCAGNKVEVTEEGEVRYTTCCVIV